MSSPKKRCSVNTLFVYFHQTFKLAIQGEALYSQRFCFGIHVNYSSAGRDSNTNSLLRLFLKSNHVYKVPGRYIGLTWSRILRITLVVPDYGVTRSEPVSCLLNL